VLQLKVMDSLTVIDWAEDENESIVGFGIAFTSTETEETASVVPDAPEHVSVNVYVLTLESGRVSLPLADLVPDQSPLAEQELAFVDDQLSVIDSPSKILVDDELNEVMEGLLGVIGVVGSDDEPPPPPPQAAIKVIEIKLKNIFLCFILCCGKL